MNLGNKNIFMLIEGSKDLATDDFKDVVKANHYMNTLIDAENDIRYIRDKYCRFCNGYQNCPYYVESTYEDDICENSEYILHNNIDYRIEEVMFDEKED